MTSQFVDFHAVLGERKATENVMPILHQVRHALTEWLDTGEGMTIDLNAIPMTEHEFEALEHVLGQGEIVVSMEALGHSEVRETAFYGVWWVFHNDGEGKSFGRYLEITDVPDIVKAQREDVQDALAHLTERLETEASPFPEPED